MAKAVSAFGAAVAERVLALARYLEGGDVRDIAASVDLPVDTLNGFFKRVLRDGLPALEDRRRTGSGQLSPEAEEPSASAVRLGSDGDRIRVHVGTSELRIPRDDLLQSRVVLLTLLENGWVGAPAVATALDLSEERLRKLRAAFRKNGATALLDRRQGQTRDYAVPRDVKAELIRQYVERVETGQSVSAPSLRNAIADARGSSPSEQTLRRHIDKLGLDRIRPDDDRPAVPKKGLRTVSGHPQ